MTRRRTTPGEDVLKGHSKDVLHDPLLEPGAEETLGDFSQLGLNARYGNMIRDAGLSDQGNILFVLRTPKDIVYTDIARQTKTNEEVILNPATEDTDLVEKTKYNYMYTSKPEADGRILSSVLEEAKLSIPSHELPGLAHAKIFLDDPSLIPEEMKSGDRFYLFGALHQNHIGTFVYCLMYRKQAKKLVLLKDLLTVEWVRTDTILRFHK